MSYFLDFLEDMEVKDLATAEDHEALETPDDQALQDLDVDKWPFQLSGDRLLGASQLCVELSDQSSSADEAVEEGLLDDLREVEEEVQDDVVEIPLHEDMPMSPVPSPCTGSQPQPPPTPAQS